MDKLMMPLGNAATSLLAVAMMACFGSYARADSKPACGAVSADGRFAAALLDAQGLDLKGVYNYGAESYDIVVIIALAAEAAKTDGIDYAKQINQVTRGGTKCTTFKDCDALIKKGTTDIDYDGLSGPLEFSGNGEPTVASYGIQQFNASDKIDDAKTIFKTAKAPAEADVAEVPVEGTRAGDGTLKIGTLLPETGSQTWSLIGRFCAPKCV